MCSVCEQNAPELVRPGWYFFRENLIIEAHFTMKPNMLNEAGRSELKRLDGFFCFGEEDKAGL